jgi:hypothetical protein
LNRQVGAWQSNKITPYRVLKSVMKFSKARLTVPSTQDWLLINNGEKLIDKFEKKVNQFYKKWGLEIKNLMKLKTN